MSSNPRALRRHFGSSSLRSAGVFDSTYGIQDDAVRMAAKNGSEALRLRLHRHYLIDAISRGGDIYDAMARAGMRL